MSEWPKIYSGNQVLYSCLNVPHEIGYSKIVMKQLFNSIMFPNIFQLFGSGSGPGPGPGRSIQNPTYIRVSLSCPIPNSTFSSPSSMLVFNRGDPILRSLCWIPVWQYLAFWVNINCVDLWKFLNLFKLFFYPTLGTKQIILHFKDVPSSLITIDNYYISPRRMRFRCSLYVVF